MQCSSRIVLVPSRRLRRGASDRYRLLSISCTHISAQTSTPTTTTASTSGPAARLTYVSPGGDGTRQESCDRKVKNCCPIRPIADGERRGKLLVHSVCRLLMHSTVDWLRGRCISDLSERRWGNRATRNNDFYWCRGWCDVVQFVASPPLNTAWLPIL